MIARRSIVALALPVVSAACSDGPTAPRASSRVMASRASHGWGAAPNSVRYADTGARPAVGRSGSAAVGVQIVVTGSGATSLTMTGHRAADLSAPAGQVVKAQLKCFAVGGAMLFNLNFTTLSANPFVSPLPPLAPGTVCQAVGWLRGIDGRRTDVVTVVPIFAHRAPDLAVTHVNAPARTPVGAPTVVTASVAELNGDFGARGDCVLLVDGVEADRARDIWVDAGDLVSCAFTTTFAGAGARELAVRVQAVTPADFDPANNEATTTVTALQATGATAVSFVGDVRDVTFAIRDTFTTRWTNAATGQLLFESRSETNTSGREQAAMFSVLIGAEVSFPLSRVELAQTSGGRALHAATWTDVPADGISSAGATCIARGVGTGLEFYLCSHVLGFTEITYLRQAGTVTYHSTDYTKTWDGAAYAEDTYVFNDLVATGVAVPWGGSYTFDVRLTDGAVQYVASAQVPVAPVAEEIVEPLACFSFPVAVPPDTYLVASCASSYFGSTGVAGTLAGSGFALGGTTIP